MESEIVSVTNVTLLLQMLGIKKTITSEIFVVLSILLLGCGNGIGEIETLAYVV